MIHLDFEYVKSLRDIPGISFIEFDEKYFKFVYPRFNFKFYAIFDDSYNPILKSQTDYQEHILQDFQLILNKEMKL